MSEVEDKEFKFMSNKYSINFKLYLKVIAPQFCRIIG